MRQGNLGEALLFDEEALPRVSQICKLRNGAKRRNEKMRRKAVAISALRPFAPAASLIATKRNPKADVHAPEEV